MGGVAKAVTSTVKKITSAVKKTIINPIVNLTYKLPLGLVRDVVIRGKSFKKTLAKHINTIAQDIANTYNLVGNKWLGINDKGFLGIKGGIFSKMGQFMQDLLHDHVTQTVGIGIAVAALVVSIFFPPAYSIATAAVVASTAVTAGSVFLTMGVWYFTLAAVSLGVSFLASAIIDASIMAMYGSEILGSIASFEQAQEALRVTNLADVLSGTIFDKMAGGWMYASQFAGDVYYDATTVGNCNISVGGEFNLTPHAIAVNVGYVDSTAKNLAGDDYFNVVSMTIEQDS